MTDTSTHNLIQWLFDNALISETRAEWLLTELIPDEVLVSTLACQLAKSLSVEELDRLTRTYMERAKVDLESREIAYRNMSPEDRDFCMELDGFFDTDETLAFLDAIEVKPVAGVTSRLREMASCGMKMRDFLQFAKATMRAADFLETMCLLVDSLNLTNDLEVRFAEFRNSPSLTKLVGHANRAGLSEEDERSLLVSFAEREGNHSAARIICDQIDREDVGGNFQQHCEWYLRFGIPEREHELLETRVLLSQRTIERLSDEASLAELAEVPSDHDADPVKDQPWIGIDFSRRAAAEFSETLDADELVVPLHGRINDEYADRVMPFRGSPRNLHGLSAFECSLCLHFSGVLSAKAMLGFVVRYLEGFEDRLLPILCQHFDQRGSCDEFESFIIAATGMNSDNGNWKSQGF